MSYYTYNYSMLSCSESIKQLFHMSIVFNSQCRAKAEDNFPNLKIKAVRIRRDVYLYSPSIVTSQLMIYSCRLSSMESLIVRDKMVVYINQFN